LIVRSRNIANDPCQTLGQPVAPVGAASLIVFSSALFTGSVFGFITWLTAWGETVPSTEIGPIVCSNQAIVLSSMVPPLAAIQGRFYYGYASGAEQQFVTFTPAASVLVGAPGATPLSGVAPYKSSAYLPDTDGDLVSASEIYRWINAGLVALGRLAGGILDQTGVAMPAGNAEVVIPGFWLSIKYTWHNGWLVIPENQSYTWLQSPVSGIPGISTLWRNGAQQIMGTWPQPSTAPSSSTLSSDMGAADNLANVLSTSTFGNADGVMLLGGFALNSASGGFDSGMVGLTITVNGAGAAGGTLTTTVKQFVSQNQILLTLPALTAVSAATFAITGTAGAGASGFTAPGMCQIDSEIMSYSQVTTNQITGIVRGYSGTIPGAHSSGARVTQLIFRLLGRRMPVPVILGQSANTLDMPQGWDQVMDLYIRSNYKATEQDEDGAAKLMQQFEGKAIELRDDQIPLESKQIGGLYPLGGAAQTLAEIQDTVVVN
jgi:hypothetical protein